MKDQSPSLWEDALLGHSRNASRIEERIREGADVNEAQEQSTPLHIAAANGATENVRVLLAHGADPNATDALGKPPVQIAHEYGHAEIVQILQEGAS